MSVALIIDQLSAARLATRGKAVTGPGGEVIPLPLILAAAQQHLLDLDSWHAAFIDSRRASAEMLAAYMAAERRNAALAAEVDRLTVLLDPPKPAHCIADALDGRR